MPLRFGGRTDDPMHPMGHAAAQAAARERGRGAAAHLKCGTRRTRFRDERRRPPQTCSQKKNSAQAAVHGCGTMVWPRCYCRGCRMRGKGESSVRRPAECGCPRGRTAAAVPPRPPRPRARGNHCVCAPHSPAHFAGCAACGAEAGSGARERREPARDATWAAVGHRMCSAVCVRSPGWTGARLGAKEMRRRSATASLRAGGYQRTKIEQLVFQSQADDPVARCVCPAPRAFRF